MHKGFKYFFIIFFIGLFYLFGFHGIYIDWKKNSFEKKGPHQVSKEASLLHGKLFIADLHSDQLLWNRNLNSSTFYGHMDLERLQKGNMGIQVFSSVTKVPFDKNYKSNNDDSNIIDLLVKIQRWPLKTWDSLIERSLYKSEKLHTFEKESQGKIHILKSNTDIENFLIKKKKDPMNLGAMLSIEGAHALEGKVKNLDRLFNAGFRMIGLTHFHDNAVGGSAHGLLRGGLTPFGEKVIKKMNQMGMIVDLAHASPKLIDDVFTHSTRPIVISHGGVKGTCQGSRNISDEHLSKLKFNGGVIGIGFWKDAVCGIQPKDIVKAIRYVGEKIGYDHVGLGADYDGSVHTLFDVSGLPLITAELLKSKIPVETIEKIMGGNVLRILKNGIPKG